MGAKRICIIGTSGSGKSTLARALEQKLSIKHIEMDSYLFEPGWVKRPQEDFERDMMKALEAPQWITCGNYDPDIESLLRKADQIIWLDYPFYKVFWRAFQRTLRRIIFKEPCCNGNYETFYQQFFTKYSIFWWITTTYAKRRREYALLRQKPEFRDKWITISNEREFKKVVSDI